MTIMHQRHHPVWRPEHDVIARLRVLRGTALISPLLVHRHPRPEKFDV